MSRSIGRFNSRAVAPTSGAMTVIVSPGVRHTASYSRSLSASLVGRASRACATARGAVVGRDGLALGAGRRESPVQRRLGGDACGRNVLLDEMLDALAEVLGIRRVRHARPIRTPAIASQPLP